MLFHNGPRFWAIEEAEAIERFRSDAIPPPMRLDVLILNGTEDLGVEPIEVIRSPMGQRYIYARPGLALRLIEGSDPGAEAPRSGLRSTPADQLF